MTTKLVADTLTKAYLKASPCSGLIIHSDQGSQYTSNEYAGLVNKLGLTHSISRCGNCYDNAVIESFYATLKKEMVYLEGVICMKEMKLKIFDYIERFYNRERRHSTFFLKRLYGLRNLIQIDWLLLWECEVFSVNG